jgi:hypothetical protein
MPESNPIKKLNGRPALLGIQPTRNNPMSPENLSRRAILAGAASVPALALPAVVAIAAPIAPAIVAALPIENTADPAIALADRAIEAWEAHGAAIDAFEPFYEAMFKWRHKNLRPAKRTLEGRDVSSSTSGLNEMERGLIGIMRLPPAEYEEQDRDYRAAVAKWERREKAAKLRTGFTKAEAKSAAACHGSWDGDRSSVNLRMTRRGAGWR